MSGDLLANALSCDRSFEAVAVQPSDLLQTLATSRVDLVVIASEFHNHSQSGFDLAHTVGREYPNVIIVLLLDQSNHDSVINAFRSGARGVFSREQPMAQFLDCVESVARGLIWAGKQETEVLLDAFRSIPALNITNTDDSPTLSVRELQAIQCAAKGKTNRAIAIELGLSEHTVKNYLFRAFEKLGVSSRVELLFYLTQRGHRFHAAKANSADAEVCVHESPIGPAEPAGLQHLSNP
jgi:DNA-binding NarL/FixJ family response regulator